MTALSTLQHLLTHAETAYHALMTGIKEVSVNIGRYGHITYRQTDIKTLETYIARLTAAIKRKQGGSGCKAIYAEF